MLRRKTITLKWLRDQHACPDAIVAFKAKYGERGRPAVRAVLTALWSNNREGWALWLMEQVLERRPATRYGVANGRIGKRGLLKKVEMAAYRALDFRYLDKAEGKR